MIELQHTVGDDLQLFSPDATYTGICTAAIRTIQPTRVIYIFLYSYILIYRFLLFNPGLMGGRDIWMEGVISCTPEFTPLSSVILDLSTEKCIFLETGAFSATDPSL
jgi:hypothetical protein